MNDSKKGGENKIDVLPSEAETPQEQGRSVIAISYEGLLPPAQELFRYNQAHPDAAHRLSPWQKQEDHRQKLETLSLFFGFIIVVTVTGAGTFLIFNNRAGAGLVIVLSGVATLVWPFISSHRSKEKRDPNNQE